MRNVLILLEIYSTQHNHVILNNHCLQNDFWLLSDTYGLISLKKKFERNHHLPPSSHFVFEFLLRLLGVNLDFMILN